MTERRAKFIDRILSEHDRQEPDCGGTIYERAGVKRNPDDLHADVVCRCARCGRGWNWPEMELSMLDDGRRVRSALPPPPAPPR